MPRRLIKLVIFPGTPCHACTHPRSSHSELTLHASCKVAGCTCKCFDPICGCGHLLCEHEWGGQSDPWQCALCACQRFGADMAGEVAHQSPIAPTVPPSRPKVAVTAKAEVHERKMPSGAVYRWGRRDLALYDCHKRGCHDPAGYWMTRAWRSPSGKLQLAKLAACGPHFRQWCDKVMPLEQARLFDQDAN